MEFKDNLKQLRLEKGLTQAQLAEKLFVSRSTVAKWENGLGLPNPESMAALEQLFDITAHEIATKEPETVIVEKNRRLRLVGQIITWTAILVLFVIMSILPVAIYKGVYGFTPDMAAGSYADEDYIDTGDYRIYYFSFGGNDLVTGTYWSDLQGFKLVHKHFWGSTVANTDAIDRVVAKGNQIVGFLYSVKGKNGYYNILRKAKYYKAEELENALVWDLPPELISATAVTIDREEYTLEKGFFFITQEPVRYFKIGDEWYDIIE